MTGYGDAACRVNQMDYAIEIKTVNNRYLKTNIKLSETTAFLQEDIEKLLHKNISRGTVTCVLRLKESSAETMFNINEPALQECIRNLSRIAKTTEAEYNIDISQLLLLPGIVQPFQPNEQQAAQIRQAVLDITSQALEKLKQMRAQEGAALAAELTEHCRIIKQMLEQIKKRSPLVIQEYQQKLKNKVDVLLAAAKLELNAEILAREVAIFAERCDIAEEIARLDSHLEQFAQAINQNSQVGRKLDFIGQEMLREANTITSKAADVEITRCIVDVKCRIDRLKEQIQNVE